MEIELLVEAIQKQLELRKNSFWSHQMPERCPPVLWFGEDIFKDGWASSFLDKLVKFLNPKIIVLFGRTNVNNFNKYICDCCHLTNVYKDKVYYSISKYKNIPIIGLSVYLADLIGFNTIELREFGEYIKRELLKDHL